MSRDRRTNDASVVAEIVFFAGFAAASIALDVVAVAVFFGLRRARERNN